MVYRLNMDLGESRCEFPGGGGAEGVPRDQFVIRVWSVMRSSSWPLGAHACGLVAGWLLPQGGVGRHSVARNPPEPDVLGSVLVVPSYN